MIEPYDMNPAGDLDLGSYADFPAGEFWYEGPQLAKRPLRRILPFGADYMENNGEHLLDVNGDGWIDGEDLHYLASHLGECWNGTGWSVAACPAALR